MIRFTPPTTWRQIKEDEVVLPRELTDEMINAGHHQIDWCRCNQNTSTPDHDTQKEIVSGRLVGTTCADDLRDAYRDMIKAAALAEIKPRTNPHYPVILRPLSDDDGGGWIAIVPDLPGCASDGATAHEALDNVLDAIKSWESDAEEEGSHMPPYCQSGRDGDCVSPICPQLRDNEPETTGRHCPWDSAWETYHEQKGDDYGR